MRKKIEILKGFVFALFLFISFLFSNILVYLLRYFILYIQYTRKIIIKPEFNILKGLFEFRFEKPYIYIYILVGIFIIYCILRLKIKTKHLDMEEKGRSRFTTL